MGIYKDMIYPRLWLAMQYVIGGGVAKRKLNLLQYQGQKRVAEVGCSFGVISKVFRDKPCEYLGVDVDKDTISFAEKTYRRYPGMHFIQEDFLNLDKNTYQFDLIIFSCLIHHIDTPLLKKFLDKSAELLAPGGSLFILDYAVPEKPSWLESLFINMDQGKFIRPYDECLAILNNVESLEISENNVYPLSGSPLPWPIIAHVFCAVMKVKEL